MLCQFTFSNYKSYRDEVTLNLCAANISEHREHLIIESMTKEEFLPLAIVYGPNGGGKSSVIDAFRYLRRKVISFQRNPGIAESSEDSEAVSVGTPQSVQRDEQIHFLFDKKYFDSPTGWSVSIITSGYEYKYMLSMIRNRISEESLYAKNLETGGIEMLFERNQGIVLGDELIAVQTGKVHVELPLLSFIAALYDYEHINNVLSWFRSVRVIDYGSSYRDIYFPLFENNDSKSAFFELLHSMGIQIDDIVIDRDSHGKVQDVFSIYRYNDENIHLDFIQESSGTKKVFSFLTHLMRSIKEGRPIFIDELDAKLHPKLLEFVISLFTNRAINSNGAQLIITSHDLHTLDNKFLRRDEIWFAAKRDDFSSHLYSLSDFKKISSKGKQPRKDENFAKQYAEGRYGADPYFQVIENWMVEP